MLAYTEPFTTLLTMKKKLYNKNSYFHNYVLQIIESNLLPECAILKEASYHTCSATVLEPWKDRQVLLLNTPWWQGQRPISFTIFTIGIIQKYPDHYKTNAQ